MSPAVRRSGCRTHIHTGAHQCSCVEQFKGFDRSEGLIGAQGGDQTLMDFAADAQPQMFDFGILAQQCVGHRAGEFRVLRLPAARSEPGRR